jgi:ribosomal-protein-alanine N-acetyltransferase
VIHTPRLLLRKFRETDVDDALACRNDPEFARFLRHIPQPYTREHAIAFVETNMTEPWDEFPTFAVVIDDRVIGTVNFNIAGRTAMIGYAIARAHWGRGVATEAARAAIDWLFANHAIDELWASTQPDNVRSRRVLEKLGMRYVGDVDDEVKYSRVECTPSASDRTGA